jgi:putative flippase GtrA
MSRIKKAYKYILKKIFGFSLVGVITTLFSGVMLYVVIHVFNGPLVLSYVLIYFVAIILSYILNMFFVFKNNIDFKGALIFFGIYLSGMGLGALFLEYFKNTLNIPDIFKAYMSIPLTMTWNFIISYLIFNPRKNE